MFLIVLIRILIVLNVHAILYIFCMRISVSASEPIGVLLSLCILYVY